MALVTAMSRQDGIIFPDRTGSTALSNMSLTAVLRRMGRSDITIHGFR
jgi:hypothetical protein